MELTATRTMKDVRIPVRDGRWLAADLFLPIGEGPWPTLLVQTPYGKERLGAALPHPSAHSWLDFWDRGRYVLAISDWRGYHGSVEAGGGVSPRHRGRDGFDLVEWIAEQKWSDGRVAGWGPSALGRALFRTAVEKPPHLVCGVPVVSHMGHHYEDFYEGGVLMLSHVRSIEALGFDLTPEIRSEPRSDTPFYRDLAQESRPELVNLPLFFITGWFDLGARQQIRFFEETRRRGGARARAWSTVLVGPWHHTAIDQHRQGQLDFPGAAGAAAEETRRFLEHWVDGARDNGWAERPRVLYWQMGEEGWQAASHWPPTGVVEREWSLLPDGALAETAPAASGTRSFVSDPANPVPTVGGANLPLGLKAGPYDQRSLEAREDVLVFTTGELAEPVRLVGEAFLTLTVSVDRPDADIAIRLTDVHPDGRSLFVADSIRRLSLRESTALPAPLTPGEPVPVTVRLPPVAQTFLPGHRIRVSVAGSNHPRYAVSDVPAEITLHFGGEARAALVLPIRETT